MNKRFVNTFVILLLFNPFTWFFSLFSSPKDLGIYKSFDTGENWAQKVAVSKTKTISSLNVLTISIDPTESRIIYLGTRGNGLHKSQDGGEHWYQVKDTNRALSNSANIYTVAIDPKNHNNIYLGAYQNRKGRAFRSTNGGQSFEETYVVSKEKYAIFAMEVDSYIPSVVYMGTAQGGLLKSNDYGKSWQVIKWFDSVIADVKTDPRDTRIVYVATYKKGIYKTTDKGATWVSFLDKIKKFKQANDLEQIIMDPMHPNTLYVGSSYGLLKTADGGNSWSEVRIIIPPKSLPVLSVAVSPRNSNQIFYTAGSVVYKSDDGGVNWTVTELPSNRNARYIAIDPTDSSVIYIGMHK